MCDRPAAMKLTRQGLLIIITRIVVLASVYFAVETVIAEEQNGRHIVDKSRCVEELYYQHNETECDGFVYWNMAYLPFLIVVSGIWALIWWTSKQRMSSP